MPDNLQSLRKSLAIYKGLVEVSGLIGSITDFDDLLKAILDVARRVISAEAASLFMVNPNHGELEMIVSTEVEGIFLQAPIRVPKGRGIAGWVFEHGESLLIPDAYADERFYKEADKQTGFHTRSILCAPLKVGGDLIGVIQVLNPANKPSFEDEDLDGFSAYANLTATAIQKLRSIERLRQQERVERDLAIASEIQSELLSQAIPSEVPGARFAAFNQAASTVGGDFYDVFVKNPYEVYFAIGDVSGKGISASLLMAQVLSAMQFVFSTATGPSDVLSKLNETLHERIVRGMFVTMLVGRYTPAAGRIDLASAGHCKPILLPAGGSPAIIETEGALPLGILGDVKYRQSQIPISPGDWMVCFTDGLSESRIAPMGELFEPQILSCLASCPSDSPGDIIKALVAAEQNARGSNPQLDDLTLLVGGPR